MCDKKDDITWADIEWMLEEKRLDLIEDAKYLEFIIDEMRKISEKYKKSYDK